ncbi:MAG: hypothetical protein RLZ68_244 [Pseudomonadota bacterium]|jgi:hypothetical protein
MTQLILSSKGLAITLLAFTLGGCAGLETTRKVYVNGEKMGAFGVAGMDQQTGRVLPDGRYWLEPVSGNWGVEGNTTPVGNVHAANTMVGQNSGTAGASSGGDTTSNSANGTAGTGRDASGNHCAFVSLPNGDSMMSCGK